MQPLPQSMRPPGQVHVLALHVAPGPQTRPHEPQLALSRVGSTQRPKQLTSPVGHAHMPNAHAAPGGHPFPQKPQFALDDETSTHPAPQSS